jgi:hypothetical protein
MLNLTLTSDANLVLDFDPISLNLYPYFDPVIEPKFKILVMTQKPFLKEIDPWSNVSLKL